MTLDGGEVGTEPVPSNNNNNKKTTKSKFSLSKVFRRTFKLPCELFAGIAVLPWSLTIGSAKRVKKSLAKQKMVHKYFMNQ